MTLEEELQVLDAKVKQLKLDYEQYFSGSRPREPVMLRAEIQKAVARWANTPIQNTAQRFKFNSVNSRFQALKRQWDPTLRKIEAGTYERHVFRADLHDRERATKSRTAAPAASGPASGGDLFDAYRDAALACGQSVKDLTPQKLAAVVDRHEQAIRKKLGCERVDFRVVVEAGKVKLKASAGR